EDTLEKMTVERAVLGLFFSGVKLSDGHGGLCFTPIKEIPEAVCCPSSAKAMPLSGRLSGRSVKSYLEDIFSDNVLKKTLGIATLNALSSSCWDKMKDKGYEIQMGIDTFDDIELQDKEKTVV
ncbi:MAG TPA: Fis family transcriptional regulator, partial [Clostridiales bacterium]|nr:Fis family transcriptional regulator [Clostridiales bacterium]